MAAGTQSIWLLECCKWLTAAGLVLLNSNAAQSCDSQRLVELYTEWYGLYSAGQYAESEPFALESVSVAVQTCGPDHPETASTLGNLAIVYENQGRYEEAEPLYLRALNIREDSLGPDQPETAGTLQNLAILYSNQGRYGEAERLYLRALKIKEDKLGTNHPDTAGTLQNLAILYWTQGRHGEAEPLFLRALKFWEDSLGPDHPETARTLGNLAALYRSQGRYGEAESLYLRALTIREDTLGPDHADTATTLQNLAILYKDQGRYGEAEPHYLRAVKIREDKLGPDHPETARAVSNLAFLYDDQGRYEEAEPLYLRALKIMEDTLGPDHPLTAITLRNLAGSYEVQARYGEAAGLYHQALINLQDRLFMGADGEIEDLVRTNLVRDWILPSIHLFLGRIPLEQRRFPDLFAAGFDVFQRLKTSSVGSEIIRSALVLQAEDPDLRSLVKSVDFANVEFERIADLLLTAREKGASPETIAELERDRVIALERRAKAQQALELKYPDFALFARPEPTTFKEFQNDLLSDGEALIAYAQVGYQGMYLAYVVTQGAVEFVPFDLTGEEIEALVSSLRAGTALPSGGSFSVRDLANLEFDLGAAHQLYTGLIAPLEPYLVGIDHLLIVPDGPLESLSFNLLATSLPRTEETQSVEDEAVEESEPGAEDPLGQARAMAEKAWAWLQTTAASVQASLQTDAGAFAPYREPAWLGDKYAISTLPTVGAIEAVRKLEGSSARQPLLGFGDPVLEGPSSRTAQSAGAEDLLTLGLGESADVTKVRQLTPIPQTGELLNELALALETTAVHLYTGSKGTEQDLNLLNERGLLRDYRTVAFATHALVAGELPKLGLDEPALVLTPPANDNDVLFSNDGLLRASEVVQLNLNADWVLLTACNTAASDGTLGAEPLSGLAKSFFKAGSRSLLVSHWPAEANAAAKLVPDLIKRTAAGEPRAEALRQAMISLRNDPDNPHFAHPALWAPFVIVGEGG